MVRMAEMAVSSRPGDVLVSLGLGSCIGLALLCDGRPIAGLAHIVLPDSGEGGATAAAGAGKFADTAVPALVARTLAAGALQTRLWAVLVGGAQMFASGRTLNIGERNEEAVRRALAAAGIRVREAVTGGSVGRTIRVYPGRFLVTCKVAGGGEVPVIGSLQDGLRTAA
jgi:chemotaxis protein CheD